MCFHLPLFSSLSAIALVWCLEWEKRYDIETLSIHGVLNKEKSCKKNVPKASPRPFFFCKQPKRAIACKKWFKNKIFWKGIIKNFLKSLLYFFFWTQSLLMETVIKNKRGLELVTSLSSGYETSSKTFLY